MLLMEASEPHVDPIAKVSHQMHQSYLLQSLIGLGRDKRFWFWVVTFCISILLSQFIITISNPVHWATCKAQGLNECYILLFYITFYYLRYKEN